MAEDDFPCSNVEEYDLIRQYAESQNWTIHRIDRTVTAANVKRRKQEEWMVVDFTLPENPN